MKRISKKQNKEFHKHFIEKTIIFGESFIISQQGHFVKPSSQANCTSLKFQIITKGYGKDATRLAHELLNMIKGPLQTLVNSNSRINRQLQQSKNDWGETELSLSQQAKQRYFVLNLIDSCFQDLSQKDYEGSCSFGFCYLLKNEIYIVKNKMFEFYMISQKQNDQYEFKTIGSKKLPFQLNTITNHFNNSNTSSKQTTGFISCDKNYQNIMSRKYFPEVTFLAFKIPKNQNLIFLMGNSQCFCHFTQEEVIGFFQYPTFLKDGGQSLIQSSKKKWKTIYQQDMTMIVSKFS